MGVSIVQMGQLRPREAARPRPQCHQALPGKPHCLRAGAQAQAHGGAVGALLGRCWGGDPAGARSEDWEEEGNRYLAGELRLQRFQLLLGPEAGAPLPGHAGAQLAHLAEEPPLRESQLPDPAAGRRGGGLRSLPCGGRRQGHLSI